MLPGYWGSLYPHHRSIAGIIKERRAVMARRSWTSRSDSVESDRLRYLQAGSPSPAVVTIGLVVLTPIPQENVAICVCVMVADQ